jgi:hypothetical protein
MLDALRTTALPLIVFLSSCGHHRPLLANHATLPNYSYKDSSSPRRSFDAALKITAIGETPWNVATGTLRQRLFDPIPATSTRYGSALHK